VRHASAALIQQKTGLVIDAYFSGTKLEWLLDNVPGARARAEAGELAFGTIDSWLVWNLTGGRVHATDASNASRTLLFNLHTQGLGRRIARTAAHPARRAAGRDALQRRDRGNRSSLFGGALPIAGIAGDQQAATFGLGLLFARHGQEHLRHGLLHADEHGCATRRQPQSPC
jgi:glycerol kinase